MIVPRAARVVVFPATHCRVESTHAVARSIDRLPPVCNTGVTGVMTASQEVSPNMLTVRLKAGTGYVSDRGSTSRMSDSAFVRSP